MLFVQGLQVYRGEQRLVAGLSFVLSKGQALHVKGHNGCGKTTLLKTLAGCHPKKRGQIYFGLQKTTRPEEGSLLYIGHENALYEALTVSEQLAYFGALYQGAGISTCFKEQCAVSFLENKLIAHLSSGQKRRLALGRLLLSTASLWLLDEPENALDREGRIWLKQILAKALDRGIAIVYTSHQETLVPSVCLELN